MNEKLAPKTGTVDKLVTLESDIKQVLSGEKTSTRRNGRLADPGESMVLQGRKFEVQHVYQQTLGEITDEDARSEGYPDLEAYKQFILSIHPGMKWIPEMTVWVHEYHPIQ